MAGPSSLSNVVSSLVRAQVGSSIPENTLDEELDKRVAELILKEARKKEERYGRTGSHSPQLYDIFVVVEIYSDLLIKTTGLAMRRRQTSASCPRSSREQMNTTRLF